ncbi:hypothetical protein [Saccharothrix syringae]|uniref:Uncharacterized protein n=1 Tax=Saccharothrix syringae TaxID=103733 RepID=A0A5Q0GZM5_SACSY|nr:hypothetical protein [Saccharothrix syringae]QFZ19004.1 hypothetical protein EKG83_17480 [Saccharothrix syringae]
MADRPDRVRADVDSWPTGRLLSVAARVVQGRFDEVLAELGLTHAGLDRTGHVTRAPDARDRREAARTAHL